MGRTWTVENAKAYVTKVVKGKQQLGLKYCSAIDFLMNHTKTAVNLHPLSKKEDEDDYSGTDR